jgi:hypothetical protein
MSVNGCASRDYRMRDGGSSGLFWATFVNLLYAICTPISSGSAYSVIATHRTRGYLQFCVRRNGLKVDSDRIRENVEWIVY